MRLSYSRFFVGVFTLANFVWLTRTSANYVGFVDSGELAIACGKLGIAHPPGYPLYTLLGDVFCTLLPIDIIKSVTLLSVVSGTAAGLLFALTLARLIPAISANLERKSGPAYLTACSSPMLLLYSPIVWSLSVTNEVYALHMMFLSAILYLIVRSELGNGQPSLRYTILIAYLIGLAFCNHSSTLFIAVGFAVWILSHRELRPRIPKLAVSIIPFLLLGISVYAYLPIRASLSPILNWGDPSNFENFIRHASGWQYRTWMFNKPFVAHLESILNLTAMTVSELPLFLLPAGVWGLIRLLRVYPRIAAFSVQVFALNIIFAAGYTIPEIDTYLLPMIYIYALWCAIGVFCVIDLVLKSFVKNRLSMLVPASCTVLYLAVGILMISAAYKFADRSGYDYADRQSDLIVRSVEPDAVVLSSNWSLYSPLIYSQIIENKAKNITAIDFELLRRSWYYDFIQRMDSTLYADTRAERERLLPLLKRFERSEPYDLNEIEDAFQSLVTAIVSRPDRPSYVDYGTQFRDMAEFTKVPQGMLYRLVREDEQFVPKPPIDLDLGDVDQSLLRRDYTLKQQLEIIDIMREESERFWDWYQSQNEQSISVP